MQAHKKINIAIIYHFFPHYRAPVLKALSQSTKYNYIFWGDTAPFSGIESFRGDNVVKINKIKMRSRGKSISIHGWYKAIFHKNPKIIIVLGNPNIIATWLVAIYSIAFGKHVLFWSHGWLKKEPKWKAWLRCTYFSLSSGVLVYGTRAIELARQEGFDANKVFPIYNSLDWDSSEAYFEKLTDDDVESVRKELDIAAGRRLLICTARLTELCRFDLLLDAMELLERQGLNLSLILVGDGPSGENLKKLAHEKKLDVRFLGAIYDEHKLSRLIFSSEITVSPGKIGLTAMHSLSYGTPVISHDNLDLQMPEVEVIQTGHNGALFAYNDGVDLANAIRSVLDWPVSRTDIRRICRQSLIGRYTPDAQVERIESTVDAILAGKP